MHRPDAGPERADDARPKPADDAAPRTRRAFVRSVVTKAAYIAPVIVATSVRRADAQVFSCKPNGSPCTSDLECCSLNCHLMMGSGKCMSMT